ncbi:uncharacterized protein V6R79_016554 [Siganus canaliculatus]
MSEEKSYGDAAAKKETWKWAKAFKLHRGTVEDLMHPPHYSIDRVFLRLQSIQRLHKQAAAVLIFCMTAPEVHMTCKLSSVSVPSMTELICAWRFNGKIGSRLDLKCKSEFASSASDFNFQLKRKKKKKKKVPKTQCQTSSPSTNPPPVSRGTSTKVWFRFSV